MSGVEEPGSDLLPPLTILTKAPARISLSFSSVKWVVHRVPLEINE